MSAPFCALTCATFALFRSSLQIPQVPELHRPAPTGLCWSPSSPPAVSIKQPVKLIQALLKKINLSHTLIKVFLKRIITPWFHIIMLQRPKQELVPWCSAWPVGPDGVARTVSGLALHLTHCYLWVSSTANGSMWSYFGLYPRTICH